VLRQGQEGGQLSFSLSPAFWSGFHRRFWGRRGTVLSAPAGVPLVSADHVFARLVAASEHWGGADRSFVPELFVEHAQALTDIDRFLPTVADRSVAGWSARVAAQLKGRTFGFVVDDYHVHDELIWRRLRQFVRELYGVTGLPGEQAKATLFLGNYARTPFGLHRGRSDNFMFAVDGIKRIRAWPDAFFRDKPDLTNRLDYERYNPESVVLEARPGDVIYWPASYWHIGEDAGGPSIAISLALFMDPQPGADLAQTLEQEIATRSPGGRPRRPRAAKGIAAGVQRDLRTLRAIAHGPSLARALAADRLNRVTGAGFIRVPPAAPARVLVAGDVVRGDPEFPLRWVTVGDEIVCSANGHAIAVPADPRMPGLLRRLTSSEPLRVGDLMARYSGTVRRGAVEFTASRREIRTLLERLLALRAITVGP
jgi:50S ribosomal protein L16 3-hydroxylase